METEHNEHKELKQLLEDNRKLLEQNNELLRKLHRHSIWAFVSRTIGFLVIIGAPVALYYYVIEPYFTSVSGAMQTFVVGLEQVPGWSQLVEALKGGR